MRFLWREKERKEDYYEISLAFIQFSDRFHPNFDDRPLDLSH